MLWIINLDEWSSLIPIVLYAMPCVRWMVARPCRDLLLLIWSELPKSLLILVVWLVNDRITLRYVHLVMVLVLLRVLVVEWLEYLDVWVSPACSIHHILWYIHHTTGVEALILVFIVPALIHMAETVIHHLTIIHIHLVLKLCRCLPILLQPLSHQVSLLIFLAFLLLLCMHITLLLGSLGGVVGWTVWWG